MISMHPSSEETNPLQELLYVRKRINLTRNGVVSSCESLHSREAS
jgi:hypothetical protein